MAGTRIEQIIGGTPMVCLEKLTAPESARVWVKLEFQNPAGSIKDRAALFMIEAAEKDGTLPAGGTIIEATSGNTGLALAMLATIKGYRAIIVMPETMSVERRRLTQAYGARVILTDGSKGMAGAVALAQDLAARHGFFLPDQFTNQNNVQAHYDTTGVEILNDLNGQIDVFVTGVGTGGTITGVGKRLKERDNNTSIVAVEPALSPLLSAGTASSHGIQGIGANFVPKILDQSIIDQVMTVKDGDALSTARAMSTKEGILCGISAGANVWAALEIAKLLGPDKNVVTIVPDTGERYLSTKLYDGE